MVFGSFRCLIVPWSFFWKIFVEENRNFRSYVLDCEGKFALLILFFIIIIIIIIIGKDTISFMQGIYTYIPETNHVPKEYNVAAILSLLFMVPISLASALTLMY
jgi:hypothetical protein